MSQMIMEKFYEPKLSQILMSPPLSEFQTFIYTLVGTRLQSWNSEIESTRDMLQMCHAID